MSNAKILIITGDGINCENECRHGFMEVGLDSQIMHINDILNQPKKLHDFQALCLPGGFSFGDELGSGMAFSNKIKSYISDDLKEFIEKKKPVIGICNGFQVLVKLGLLPNYKNKRTVTLAHNENNKFIDKWVILKADTSSKCMWTKGIDDIELPIRHGEGRIMLLKDRESEIYNELLSNGQIPLRYEVNPNGSYEGIAALCDPSGLIFGLMPHPEAAFKIGQTYTGRLNDSKTNEGNKIFKNLGEFLK